MSKKQSFDPRIYMNLAIEEMKKSINELLRVYKYWTSVSKLLFLNLIVVYSFMLNTYTKL